MKTHSFVMMAAVLTAVLAFSGESFARGGAGGGGGGRGAGVSQGSQSTSQVRPAGSQRRDGTFLQTGTTASGATTRPSNGRGVMDGTGVHVTPPVTTPVTQ